MRSLDLATAAAAGGAPPPAACLFALPPAAAALPGTRGSHAPLLPAELLPGDEAPPGLAQRLLAPGGSSGGSWVLDGAAFVAAAEALPAPHVRASLENCLLECTSTRLAQLSEQPSLSATKVNTGTAALVQLLVGAGRDGGQPPELFPPSAGLPSLGELLAAAVLPPSATSRLLPQPVVQLFAAHCSAGAGRRSAAEHYDLGSLPTLYDRAYSHTRAAACRGGTFYTLLSGPPLWQRFHLQPAGSGGGSSAATTAAGGAARPAAGKAAAGKQPRQKRKQESAAAGGGAAAAGELHKPQPSGTRPPLEPCTLLRSACSCCQPDLGVLWCSHRFDAMHALLSDPALHVLDCDALEALLAPLSQRQLAQLLLTGEGQCTMPGCCTLDCVSCGVFGHSPHRLRHSTLRLAVKAPGPSQPHPLTVSPSLLPPLAVAFACGTLPYVLLSLQLPPERQAALFLPRLGSLVLAQPTAADLRMCCYTAADATQAAYYGPGDPYLRCVRPCCSVAAPLPH